MKVIVIVTLTKKTLIPLGGNSIGYVVPKQRLIRALLLNILWSTVTWLGSCENL